MFSTSNYGQPDKKAQYEELQRKLAKAESALAEAKAYADAEGLSFRMSPAYGMGGTYYGTSHPEFAEINKYANYENGLDDGWSASSSSC